MHATSSDLFSRSIRSGICSVQLRFVSPVHVGKKIRMRVKLVKCEDIQSPGGKGNVRFHCCE